jgi:hypothetical protein
MVNSILKDTITDHMVVRLLEFPWVNQWANHSHMAGIHSSNLWDINSHTVAIRSSQWVIHLAFRWMESSREWMKISHSGGSQVDIFAHSAPKSDRQGLNIVLVGGPALLVAYFAALDVRVWHACHAAWKTAKMSSIFVRSVDSSSERYQS